MTMTATEEKPEEKAPATVTPSIPSPDALSEKATPAVNGLVRRSHKVFQAGQTTCFRVNFHDQEQANKVITSYFVTIRGMEVKKILEVSGKLD